MHSRILVAAATVFVCAQPAAGQSLALPIAQGLWADADQGCAGATGIFFYDGAAYGDLDTGGVGIGPQVRVNPIRRVAPGAGAHFRGFTHAWTGESTTVAGDISVRAAGPDRFVMRFVSFGSGGSGGRVDVEDRSYQRCAFARLPVRLQATIRQLRPQLASGGSSATAAATASPAAAPAPVAPLNIRPGHYVPVAQRCGSDDLIFYYDGRRLGWIDAGPFNPAAMDAVAAARRRGNAWVLPAGETLRVLAADRIATSDPNTGDETLRWCAPAEVRLSARPR